MILFRLACDADHAFESWFPSDSAFGEQAAAGLVTCPVCASASVRKAVMAPAILGKRSDHSDSSRKTEAPLVDPRHREIRNLIRGFRDKVLQDAQDVGTRFPEEARRMHEGEIPTRHIHGQASLQEARGLLEDGIMVMPIPALPDDLN